jgi:hypothetical protein
MESLYIESTIPSYLTSRPSEQELIARRQKFTRKWWDEHRIRFRLYTSIFTFDEVSQGDPDAAKNRIESLKDVHELTLTDHVEEVAVEIIRLLQIPDKAMVDAYHLAICIVHQVAYLLTWNCKHLANPENQKILIEYGRYKDLHIPVICTPAYFFEEESL